MTADRYGKVIMVLIRKLSERLTILFMAKFDELIEETKSEIRILLRNPDVRPAFMTYDQLRDVQSEICRMARVRNPEIFFPYYPKGMADACWLPDHPLVIKLNLILDLYINREF